MAPFNSKTRPLGRLHEPGKKLGAGREMVRHLEGTGNMQVFHSFKHEDVLIASQTTVVGLR